MPVASTDPSGGVIITDWYEDSKVKGERFKVKVLIIGNTLDVDGIELKLSKQKLDDKGIWRNVKITPHVARDLEDTIITRARQIQKAQNPN
jgi:hypothetical protein